MVIHMTVSTWVLTLIAALLYAFIASDIVREVRSA
jgi:hypothetical protein